MLLFEYSTIFGIIALTPPGHSWLGATITNSSDTAVYINYLSQASNSLFLKNLYAEPEHIARFDPFWSFGGLLVRFGLSPIEAHEILRIITTIILAVAIYITAINVTSNYKDARLASWLMLAGMSTGWIYSVYMSITNSWRFGSSVPSDLCNEFAIAPVLLGGAHMILSSALLLLNARWIWQIINNSETKLIIPWFFIAYHIGFHPYYAPIYGIISLIALICAQNKLTAIKKILIVISAFLPGSIYYLYLICKDAKLREHHFVVNQLPLDPVWMWLIVLLPLTIAYIWILWNKTKIKFAANSWVWAWLTAAIICILLPLPWKRKFAQALLPAMTILTLPFWLYIS